MTSSLVRTPQTVYNVPLQSTSESTPYCTLQWRRGQLLVKSPGKFQQPYLPALENQQLLIDCLKHSPVNLVSVDPKIGETWVKFWADACKEAHKPMFLYGYSENLLFKQNSNPWGWFLRLFDLIAALFLLLLLSPAILGLLMLLQITSPDSLFSSEWYVGERGRLFQAIKFSTTSKPKLTPLIRWMRKSGLENLPQLFNVLRGDMGFIGSRYWTLTTAIRLSSEAQISLNQLPVMTKSWPAQAEVNLIINNS
ncbi:sugar transferase [Nostoc piscinale CENA21]|uniref:Sugar transferase n=1 Tax=Nostoc piscinale CENA21 TaxID=224013 RepID=A0A0M4STY2_9NOSO|nr:heterocyst development glycosyltransferase HepC [Nostoc piscinale]ALF51734.1 sugar transferase [Nostoc piscinale CENA21]